MLKGVTIEVRMSVMGVVLPSGEGKSNQHQSRIKSYICVQYELDLRHLMRFKNVSHVLGFSRVTMESDGLHYQPYWR